MIKIEEQPQERIEAVLAGIMRCPQDRSAVIASSVAEQIRAVLFGAMSSDRTQAVHTLRLLATARRAVDVAWPIDSDVFNSFRPPPKEDYSNDILRRLATLGDAWDSGKGQWIATPLRIVTSDQSAHALILGSAPMGAVEERLGTDVLCAGTARFISTISLKEPRLIQDVDDWLGPAQPLDLWTANFISAAETSMEKVGGLLVDQLEVYGPDILRAQRRSGRWISVDQVSRPLDGIRLCRPKGRYALQYDRPFYLGYFEYRDGSHVLQRHAAVPHDVSLRLRFGLDSQLRTPRRFVLVLKGDAFTIEKPLTLPEPESRIYALGWRPRVSASGDETLTFHSHALPLVLRALERLSINPTISRRPVE
ncbi:hypothetical protein [Bradyrhizobium sp. CB3481]|uniref:hypothetical protein n=1 Tax=Bradyrhizobium sp. CB3481 TaxID=3039158 RepID=UPI0024B1453A|nr:hypothetical protein [Bradyrhizobium sp. CB3481]WFU16459.1 hypothetical protein QA643_36895 [Bradyrhizobium sp. CB3481]